MGMWVKHARGTWARESRGCMGGAWVGEFEGHTVEWGEVKWWFWS